MLSACLVPSSVSGTGIGMLGDKVEWDVDFLSGCLESSGETMDQAIPRKGDQNAWYKVGPPQASVR